MAVLIIVAKVINVAMITEYRRKHNRAKDYPTATAVSHIGRAPTAAEGQPVGDPVEARVCPERCFWSSGRGRIRKGHNWRDAYSGSGSMSSCHRVREFIGEFSLARSRRFGSQGIEARTPCLSGIPWEEELGLFKWGHDLTCTPEERSNSNHLHRSQPSTHEATLRIATGRSDPYNPSAGRLAQLVRAHA
jgi:hypothetical protein